MAAHTVPWPQAEPLDTAVSLTESVKTALQLWTRTL